MKWLLGVLLVLLLQLPVLAVDNELQHWEIVTLRVDAPHRLSGYVEVQPRGGLNTEGMERLLFRPAIGYRLSKNVSVWQGYAWIPGFRDGAPEEHRIFQQLLVEHKWRRLKIHHRVRLEERWVDNSGGTAVRARHQMRFLHPIGDSKKWSWVGYNELFWNVNDTKRGPQAGFDQNRVFAGIHRKLGDSVNAEAGYLLNYVNRQHPAEDKLNHVIHVGLNMHVK